MSSDKYDQAIDCLVKEYHSGDFFYHLECVWNAPSDHLPGGYLFQFVNKFGLHDGSIEEGHSRCGCLTQVAYRDEICEGPEQLREDILATEEFNVNMENLADIAEYLENETTLRNWLNKFAEFQRRIDKEVRCLV